MYVYVLGGFNLRGEVKALKIGVTDDVERRIKELQTGQILEIRMIAAWDARSRKQAFAAESEAHARYKKAQMRGEWFRPHILRSLPYWMSDRLRNRPCMVGDKGADEYLDAAKRAERKKVEAEARYHDMSILSEWRSQGFFAAP
jgi:hypothetical protein